MLESLVGCAGVTLRSVATAMGIHTGKQTRIEATGDWDAAGTLGVSKEVPVGVQAIRMLFEVETDADEKTVETLIKLTERYCVVYQSLSPQVPISSEIVVKPLQT